MSYSITPRYSIPFTVAQRARREATTPREHAALDNLSRIEGTLSDVLIAGVLLTVGDDYPRALDLLRQLPDEDRSRARSVLLRVAIARAARDRAQSARITIWGTEYPSECRGRADGALTAVTALVAELSRLIERARREVVEAA